MEGEGCNDRGAPTVIDHGIGAGPGGYCHIWAIQVCAAVKGMVFKQFTLG